MPHGNWDTIANISISFICSIQVESFRKLNGNTFATTMCTGNLRSASELMYRFKHTRNKYEIYKSLQYIGIILFFIFGAVLGVLLTNYLFEKSVLICCIILTVVFGIMYIKKAFNVFYVDGQFTRNEE